jgi:hypothetical protein
MLAAAAANIRNGRYNNMQEAMDAQVAFSKKYPASTPAENAAQLAASQKMLLSQDQRPRVETKTTRLSNIPVAGTGASGPPGRNYTAPTAKSTPVTYTAKKSSAKAAVKNYSTKTINNSFSARRDVRNLFA